MVQTEKKITIVFHGIVDIRMLYYLLPQGLSQCFVFIIHSIVQLVLCTWKDVLDAKMQHYDMILVDYGLGCYASATSTKVNCHCDQPITFNCKLKIYIQMLSTVERTVAPKTPKPKPRLFCDICKAMDHRTSCL